MTSPRVIYFGIRPQKSAAEVGGWSKVDQMGLKDALTYDTATRKYHNYTKSQVINLIETLQTANLIVGFNQLQFDYKILSSYTDTDFDALPNFDMLSKIEGTLNFRVSRDNLAQNTLGELEYSKGQATLGKRIDTTKKLFAHGCKEGYLSYYNNRFGTKEMCDTSSWADTARSITQRKELLDPIVAPSEPKLPQFTPAPRTPRKSLKEKPISRPIAKQIGSAHGLSLKEYLLAKYVGERIPTKYLDEQIPEEALQIYGDAKNQKHHHPALYTYKKVKNLLDPSISFQQFNVGIVGLWLDQNPHKSNYKNGNSRYYYIDGSGTVASERVNDYIDIINIKEELARGI